MSLSLAIPGATLNFPEFAPDTPASLSNASKDLVVICLFGSPAHSKSKASFFEWACGLDGSPEQSPGASPVRRGTVTSAEDRAVELWNFPSLYEGVCMRDSETMLCVGAYLKACSGRLRGFVYMRGPDDEDEERQAFSLFKSLVGNDVLEKSTIIIPEGGSPSSSRPHFDAPVDLLARLIDQSPIDTLYHRELSRPGTSLSDTTVGIHFDKILSDATETISRAREHVRAKTLAVQESGHPADTSPRRSRKSTEASLAHQLAEARKQLAELEGRYAGAEGRSSQFLALTELNTALGAENEELRSRNFEQDEVIQSLRGEAKSMRVGSSLGHVGTQTQAALVDAGPFQTDPIVDEVATKRQEELISLQSEVARIAAEKDKAISRADQLSKQLVGEKAGVVELKRTIASLEKDNDAMKKRIEGFSKGTDKQRQNLEEAKAETSALQRKLKEAEAELLKSKKVAEQSKKEVEQSKKEIERVQAKEGKLEEERRSAIKVSEDCLKVRDESKAELATVRSQVDSVQKQAKKKIDDLQKSLNEKEAQVVVISKAAGAWVGASAEVEKLKGEHQEAQAEIVALQTTLRTEREGWETERGLADTDRQRLEREEAAREAELREERQTREREVEGYLLRMSELEAWGQSRWDAVGAGCVIA